MHTAMRGNTLPRLELVRAVITCCGGSQDDIRAWVTAWRRIDYGDASTTAGSISPPPVA
jgi:hypothetical protein